MNKAKVEEIYKKLCDEWDKKYGLDNINTEALEMIYNMLEIIPDEDGMKRVTNMETGKTYLVPIEDIILNGVKASELSKYPETHEMQHYCKEHLPKKPIVLPGGTYCSYHNAELCRDLRPHCRICGKGLN